MEDIKLNITLKQFNSATIGFYNYIVQEGTNPNSTIAKHIRTPQIDELLQVIENEFEELRKPATLAGILKILHLTIQHTQTSISNIANLMKDMLAKHSSTEEDHIIATKIVYQILCSLPNDFSVKSFHTSAFITEILQTNDVDSAKLQTQIALCRSLLIEKFQINTLLETIWKQILTSKSYGLLVHYIDSLISKNRIYERSTFWEVIETLLSAELRDDRKLGIFLIRKVLRHLSTFETDTEVEKFFHWKNDFSNQLLSSWLAYLTILENLEEKQSHLILPSLETLRNVTLGENTPWIRIVLLQMLRHNNTLVLGWSVDYLFRNFTNFVLHNRILHEFLIATNNTWLYNENATSSFKLPTFDSSEQKWFLEVFAEVPWKSVPMHAWLLRMNEIRWSSVECKLLNKIAARLRQLQNRFIRSHCRNIFSSIFESNIDDMALGDFINFLDSLYSSTDCLSNELLFKTVQKIGSSPHPFISSNLCAILRRQQIPSEYELILMNAFDKVRMEEHRWFRILVMFGFVPVVQQKQFCQKHYNINISQPNISNISLEEAMSENVTKLSWDDFSRAVIREATIDWFASNSKDINQSDCEVLLDGGGVGTLISIANPTVRSFPIDPSMLNRLIAELSITVKKMVDTDLLVSHLINSCAKDQPKLFLKYVNEILDIDVSNNRLALNVFKSVLNLCNYTEAQDRQLLIRGLLFGEPLSGDLRIENEYAVRISLSEELKHESTNEVRRTCLRFLKNLGSPSIQLLKTDLIAKSKEMSIRKPRYFENSKHHRLKLRIAQALAVLNQIASAWDDYYLFAILQENNQTNVTYIYEFIVATTISKSELMRQMENLKNLSTSCQVSMFAISYLYTINHRNSEEFVKMLVALLLPWTMGANFNTRLYAQITICQLLQKFKIKTFDYLKIAIDESLRENPNAYEKLLTDVRYNFPDSLNYLDTDPILYVTTVPEDEHNSSQLDYLNKFESLKVARNRTLSKRETIKEKENEFPSKPIIEDVQRKMNPELSHNNELTPDSERNIDMIVVASLIDKLPNLGGIARTCEVLGIKNLVLDSTKHAQNKEFKNLSMTAENWIHISEVKPNELQAFLVDKKNEGYEVVGAEQTAQSINFMQFKFPSKCILLLGHEKEGIPADLIAFLDYAVEIPQYGMVRSLNVHVTGALFMYEYCKQHLSSPKVISNKCL